jgi:phosphoenolpyruvate synthase/pyruvate phosphate dikinase
MVKVFFPRAASYRYDMGFDHTQAGLSVGVQKMVRSDLASSGVIFTLDTESGFRDVVFVTSAYGLGENVVQGRVAPDEFYVFKPTLRQGFRPLIWKRLGAKEQRMIYDEAGNKLVKNVQVSPEDRARFSIGEEDVLTLTEWAMAIEEHYTTKRGVDMPMDIEWAKDGRTGELFIVQARPETVHSQRIVMQVYVMAEITSNIVLADQFSELFDGFSIGSNDLTQLTLGVDRDSTQIAALFDERNDAVLRSCAQLIETAHKYGRKVGICGQAPSDYPAFAAFLVEQGIDSMSLIPDAILRTTADVLVIEGERVTA